jgi:hypothetical protein
LIKLFTSPDPFLIQSVKSELDALSIPYLVKNEFAGGAMGELPWQESQPELWLVDESWSVRANKVVSSLMDSHQAPQQFPWVCSGCNEPNGAAFDMCWQCGESRL